MSGDVGARVTASVPTESGSRYLQQLCKHWSHKFPVEFTADHGSVTLPLGTLAMTADAHALEIVLDAAEPEQLPRLKEVTASHLDRFAFREAPLTFDWVEI